MTVDEMRDHIMDALETHLPSRGHLTVWIDTNKESNLNLLQFKLFDINNPDIKDIWIPWLLQEKKAYAIAIAWEDETEQNTTITVEILSPNRKECFFVFKEHAQKKLERKQATNVFFTPEKIEKYRKLMRKSAMLENG